MERARDLLSRPLPNLLRGNHATEHPSDHARPVSATFWGPWQNFYAEIRSAYDTLDLDQQLNLAHPSEPELYIVANELGMTGRLNANLFTPVARALNTTRLRGVVFGDIDAAFPELPSRPDVMLFHLQGGSLEMIAPGEVKTEWTIGLALLTQNLPPSRLARFERVIGRLPFCHCFNSC